MNRSRANSHNDQGMSLPLVMAAMLVFSIMIILLAGVAVSSVRHSNLALHRTEALAAAESGAQDYVNRMNGFASFDSWTAERTKRMREKGTPAGSMFPKIVHDSALARWVKVEGSSRADYTYDIVGNNSGLIVRVTGRAGVNHEVKRSIEYRITRNSDSAVAYVGNRGYANTDAYAQQAKLFENVLWEQGLMGVNLQTGKRHTVTEYDKLCNLGTEKYEEWRNCWRPTWNGYDKVEGNFITRAPQTIHGPKSYMYGANAVDPKLFRYADISGSVTIQLAAKNRFTHPSGFTSGGGLNFYSDKEAAHLRNRKTWSYLPFDETVGSSPANFNVIREESNTFDSCVFRGSTHVILHGDVIYVRSPHTPQNENDMRNDWCKNATRKLQGKTKRTRTPDISKQQIQAGNFLKPADESSWVKIEDLPDDALFLVQKTGVNKCDSNFVGDQSTAWKSTGIGFPGSPPTVSSAEPGQQNLYKCENGDLFIEGAAAFRKTFAAEDNIYLTGGIRYTDREPSSGRLPVNSDDYLGLVAKRNVIVYNPAPVTDGSCTGDCNKMPRSPYRLPTREQDLSNNEQQGQGAFTSTNLAQWRKGIGEEGGIMNDPTSGSIDAKPGWLALPQFDAAIVAEEGSFFLENMNILANRPARKGSGYNETPLVLKVHGSVYSKYAPVFHIDRLPPRNGSLDGRNPNTNMIEVYGMNQHFLFDKRFTKRLPPGFSGHSDSAYRATSYAEVFQNHLDGGP